MCGIMGFVGKPKGVKEANLSYQLATKLLAETVSRGSHATGTYVLQPPKEEGGKDRVFIYKLDAPSTQYVKTDTWKKLYKNGYPWLLLGHCRFYTHGSPTDHVNNHPHFSDDKKLALIHNGVISGYEGLKKTYPVKGECDSEVLLRIIQSETEVTDGIKKVFRVVNTGSMACMAAQYDSTARKAYYYAFRNESNPLVMIDLRKEIGQIFFASTKDIAEKAMKNSGMPKEIRDVAIVDVPSFEIWKIASDTLEIEKIAVEKPVERSTSYYGYGTGCRSRASGVQTVEDDDDTTLPFPQRTGSTAGAAGDQVRRLRALIDTIVESVTEIDESLNEGTKEVFGQELQALETDLSDLAWQLEQIVNPQLNDKAGTGTGTLTEPAEYD